MIVMKFGGTSVRGAERIRRVVEVVRGRLPRKPVIVVSAMRGTTDGLIELGKEAAKGRSGGLQAIYDEHWKTISDLGLSRGIIEREVADLSLLVQGISMLRELSARSLDRIASFGERLSVRIIAAALEKAGIPAVAHDAYDVGMLTDGTFGAAHPLPEADAAICKALGRTKALAVVTGYIGKSPHGDITTLGRNGSDYTATILGGALGADEVEIWTDVDGVMTADPAVVDGVKSLGHLSFAEASELAYYGGRVLHPATLLPAVRRGIPIRVLNTFRPDAKGTVILAEPSKDKGVRSIAYKKGQHVISVSSADMLLRPGFLARIFEVLARNGVVVDMVSTSEVSVSATADNSKGLSAAAKELEAAGFSTRIEAGLAMICVVGDGIKDTPGVAGDVFGAMKQAKINVEMISQGASKINVAFLVREAHTGAAVKALHAKLFG